MNKTIETWSDKSTGKYDLAVIIGRFQPLHNGHLELFKRAKEIAHKTLVIVGSAHAAPNIKNPFTFKERQNMILSAIDKNHNLICAPVSDYHYSDQDWLREVQEFIKAELQKHHDVVLVGHKKDHSSFYLDMFPDYEYEEVPNHEVLDSSTIRDIFFEKKMIPQGVMPSSVVDFLVKYKKTDEYLRICEEHEMIKAYRAKFANAPFPPTFVTTDAVVINNGYILLVKRRMAPGKGLWALPGGFLNQHERIIDGTIRELEEETRIKVPTERLRNSIRQTHVFDAPSRSERGRTITHASLIVLYERKLPKVRGSDDAVRAKWVSIADFYNMQSQMFEDHFSVASFLINRAE